MPAPLASPHRGESQPTNGARPAGLLAHADRILTIALLGALTVLFVEVLFEAWVQELLGNRTVDDEGLPVGDLPGWPKALKNGLLLALVALSAAKITVERRWRDFTTRADVAVVVLAAVMAVAGLLGTSGPTLIGQALFVYLRGAIVFYAVRALAPTWAQVRRVLWVVGGVLAINVAVALVQTVVGRPAYSGLGWVDMTWADISRAHGLLDHPNHLGHVLGLVLIGLVAWMTGLPRVSRGWWIAVVAASAGLAATQSRESMFGVLAAAAVIWFLRRRRGRPASATSEPAGPGGEERAPASPGDREERAPASAELAGNRTSGRSPGKTAIIVSLVVGVLFAANQLAHPGNLDELIFRIQGVFYATQTTAGEEDCSEFETIRECTDAGVVESREIRLLFFQQGARLLADRPVLGYGVGQFGGIVAEQHDPNWELDPRFPGGFNLYDFEGTTVDSFWLHLVVEVGVLGLLAYLAWLWLIAAPLLGATNRFAGRRVWGTRTRAPDEVDERTRAVALWGVAAMLFTVLVGVFSPALEDPLFPPLVFAVFGLGWVLLRDDPAPGASQRGARDSREREERGTSPAVASNRDAERTGGAGTREPGHAAPPRGVDAPADGLGS